MEPTTKHCLEKVLEIPIVNSVSLNVETVYNNLKSKSKISEMGLEIVEESFILAWQGLNPFICLLRKPIHVADSIACSLLDEVKVKYPTIMEPTDKLIESGTKVVLHSPLIQKALVGLEKAMGFAEAVVTLVPSISVSDEEDDEQATLISKTLKPVKHCYVKATWPLRFTANFLHSRRTDITEITRELQHSAVTVHQSEDRSKTLVAYIFYIPWYLLGSIGRATSELCERKFHDYNQRQRSEIEPSTSGRVCPPSDDTAFDEVEDQPSNADLNVTANTSASDDATYHACRGNDESVDSIVYHSGSDGEDDNARVTFQEANTSPRLDSPENSGPPGYSQDAPQNQEFQDPSDLQNLAQPLIIIIDPNDQDITAPSSTAFINGYDDAAYEAGYGNASPEAD